MKKLTAIEICAGAGGQAIGLEQAGFRHLALVEIDRHASSTLRANVPEPDRVFETDVRDFLASVRDGRSGFSDVDLLAGGVPCPPFSLAGKQLGQDDERDLFPVMLDLVEGLRPKAVMIENVRGLLQEKFSGYRGAIRSRLLDLGYVTVGWSQFNASDFGVAQQRPRSVLVAMRSGFEHEYSSPSGSSEDLVTVADVLEHSMAARGLRGKEMKVWSKRAARLAPTLVGGSKKHGGADLGPSRAKATWELMGVDGHGLANDDELATLTGPKGRGPRLTVSQAALLQGFPATWQFEGGKTARYRQVGNAFPPPVAFALGTAIKSALDRSRPRAEPGEAS